MNIFSVFSCSLNSRAYSLYIKLRMQTFSTTPDPTRFSAKPSISPSLHRRISHLGDPNLSVTPVLDRWVEEGNAVNKSELIRIVKKLMTSRRFKHALELSLWMTNKGRMPVAPVDIVMRLNLIFKLSGLKGVENYFHKVPENLKAPNVFLALLNCYTIAKSLDKAEALMLKARALGYTNIPVWYNLMMNLHYKLGNVEKVVDLLSEMETEDVAADIFTYCVCLRACALASDSVGMDKVVNMLESDKRGFVHHWRTYVTAAKGYLEIGLVDKALVILEKLEGRLATSDESNVVFLLLFKLYAKAGKRDEIYRIWEVYKRKGKVVNKVYSSMMRALMKIDDLEGMEKIYEEWESKALQYDFRVSDCLIDAYCKGGCLEKAEALIKKELPKGGHPTVATWCHLAGGYLEKNRVPESVEALKKAISLIPPNFMSEKKSLTTCLGYLENGDCLEKAEELINWVRKRRISRDASSDDDFCGLVKDRELDVCGY